MIEENRVTVKKKATRKPVGPRFFDASERADLLRRKYKKSPTEADEQAAFVEYMEFKQIAFFAVPNEGAREKRFGARLKRGGLKAGVPDLILVKRAPVDGRPVAVEMKRKSGGKVSEKQGAFHMTMRANGWYVIVAEGCDRAIEQLEALGY